jgi:MGT family glycosyltransferase
MNGRSYRFLFPMFDSGGNVPPILAIVDELVRRGHQVRALIPRLDDDAVNERLRQRAERAGARCVLVPIREPREFGVPPARGLILGRTSRAFGPLCFTHTQYKYAPGWAEVTAEELVREDADVIATDHMLPGPLVAAEAASRPSAALLHTIYFFRPASGMPPPGVGLFPARNRVGRVRDSLLRAAIDRVYRRDAIPAMNIARQRAGLADLTYPFEEYDRADRVLILAARSFDLPVTALPANVRYTGMPFERPASTEWSPPWPESDARPLILVGFSTNPQGQGAALARLMPALGRLNARVLVTLGPSLRRESFSPPPNVWVEPWVPHNVVMPQVRLAITHGGHGTVMQALRHGVPVACLPQCCDQYDIAVRVVMRRVGARLSPSLSTDRLAAALGRLLDDDQMVARARQLGEQIRGDRGSEAAADELERLAQRNGAHA